jgi:hypothetical protein
MLQVGATGINQPITTTQMRPERAKKKRLTYRQFDKNDDLLPLQLSNQHGSRAAKLINT